MQQKVCRCYCFAPLYCRTGFTVWQKGYSVSNFANYQQHLDTSGLACPMPLLKTKLALRELSVGERLLVIATDSGSWRDIRKYVEMSGHELLAAAEVNGQYQFLIRKGV